MKAAYPARCLFHLRAMQQLTRLPEFATTEFSSAAATPPLVGGMTAFIVKSATENVAQNVAK